MNDSNQKLLVGLNLPATIGIRDDKVECPWPVSARGMAF